MSSMLVKANLRALTPEQEKEYDHANTIFTGAVLRALVDCLVDANIQHTDRKELWDALTTKYDALDAGSDLYIMESFHDYKMADNCSIVEQAHEIQCIAKELDHLKIVLPD
jgi:2-C-methyl-D-erythritol 4-phosphate cytidylyltransferase